MGTAGLGFLGRHQLKRRPGRYVFAAAMGAVMGVLLGLPLISAASIERAWVDSAQLKTAGHSAVIVPADADHRAQLFDEPAAHPIWQGRAHAIAAGGAAPDVQFYFTTTRPPIDRFMASGAPPEAPGEVAVSKQVALALGVAEGDLLKVGTEQFEITGVFRVPAPPDEMVSIVVTDASPEFTARDVGLDDLAGPTFVTSTLADSPNFELIAFSDWNKFNREALQGVAYTLTAVASILAVGVGIFAVALWFVVMNLVFRRSRSDVLALQQSGFPIADARSSVLWPQLLVYVGSLLLTGFVITVALAVWSRPVSWLFEQDWVSVGYPVATWGKMLAGVGFACVVMTSVATQWRYTNNRASLGSSGAIWVLPALLSLGLVLYNPQSIPLWFLVGTVGISGVASLVGWTILILLAKQGARPFLLHQRNMTTVTVLLGLLIFVPSTFVAFDAVYVSRLSGQHPYVPQDALTINNVRLDDVDDLVRRLSAIEPERMTIHWYATDSSHLYQVTTSNAVACFQAEDSPRFTPNCFSPETLGFAALTVDGGYSSSSSWRVRPSLIDDEGLAGIVVFEKMTGEFVRSEIVEAVPAEEFAHPYVVAGQIPGEQAESLSIDEDESEVILRGFSSLDAHSQAQIHQVVFEEAPYAWVQSSDSAAEDVSTQATGIVVFAMGFVASLLVVVGTLRNFSLADSGLDQTAQTMNISGARHKYVVRPVWVTVVVGYVATLVTFAETKSLWGGYSMWDVALWSSITVVGSISIVLPLSLVAKQVKEW